MAARGLMGWRELLLLRFLKPRSMPGVARRTWPAEPWAVSPATGCHCALTDDAVPSHPPRGNPGEGEQLPRPDCRCWLSFRAGHFSLIHLNRVVTSDLVIFFHGLVLGKIQR